MATATTTAHGGVPWLCDLCAQPWSAEAGGRYFPHEETDTTYTGINATRSHRVCPACDYGLGSVCVVCATVTNARFCRTPNMIGRHLVIGKSYVCVGPHIASGAYGAVYRDRNTTSSASIANTIVIKVVRVVTGRFDTLAYEVAMFRYAQSILGVDASAVGITRVRAGRDAVRPLVHVATMPFCGVSLSQWRKQSPTMIPGEDTVREIARKVLRAVALLHDAGMTHGDLMPSNITTRGCIIDYGLAVPHSTLMLMWMDMRFVVSSLAYALAANVQEFQRYLARTNGVNGDTCRWEHYGTVPSTEWHADMMRDVFAIDDPETAKRHPVLRSWQTLLAGGADDDDNVDARRATMADLERIWNDTDDVFSA